VHVFGIARQCGTFAEKCLSSHDEQRFASAPVGQPSITE
jgi:hypothetical protein